MDTELLKARFLALLPPPHPNDWEAEEVLAHLRELPIKRQEMILHHVQSIWPVSNSLCYSYLAFADAAFSCLAPDQINDWVATLLDTYEKAGLKAAHSFLMDVENNYLCRIRGETGFSLNEVVPLLKPYAQGISRRQISLEEGPDLHTDTATIFLPARLTFFPRAEDNFLLYKLMITGQLELIKAQTYYSAIGNGRQIPPTRSDETAPRLQPDQTEIEEFWHSFPEPRLAEDLFTLAEGHRITGRMIAAYPGLWRDTAEIRRTLAAGREPLGSLPEKSRTMEALAGYILTGRLRPDAEICSRNYRQIMARFAEEAESAEDSAAKTAAIYEMLIGSPQYEPVAPLPYLGRLRPAEAHLVRLRERAETREKFIKGLAAIILETDRTSPPATGAEDPAEPVTGGLDGDGATAMIINRDHDQEKETEPAPAPAPTEMIRLLTIGNPDLELPDGFKKLADRINDDLGQIPNEYISAAVGVAGQGIPSHLTSDTDSGQGLSGAVTYDEWDYRRAGFRKNWCSLNSKEVNPVRSTFVHATLEKYRGLRRKLKKQFEMLRCTERVLKRQRDGDDLDLDAVIESISDIRAGRPESENLFLRLHRDARDIAALFLIDMSSSTEGWVGEALKETLILMGESLEVLGDRYAIAGFSGMRRTRSDFYHIKDFAETYNDLVKGKIAAISPKEYTRMGPPVRHATRILAGMDARVRLLIILSDGKPEDYDDYKGKYAIEDTRHALIETRAAGINPFCITIDRKAQDYTARMCGEGNYIFLDKVSDLPLRMPTIYRNLTT